MTSSRSLVTASLFCCIVFYVPCMAIQCIGPNGKPVDWFIVYKLPILKDGPTTIIKEGFGHFYMDDDSPQWMLSNVSVADKHNHAISNTLQQIYNSKPSDKILYLIYNDKDSNGRQHMNKGHTKGVVSFDNHQGFWLVHSTPKFPPVKTMGYSWPDSARDFGQSFLCVTYDYKMLNSIGLQLLYNHPEFYDNQTDGYLKENPNIRDALNAKPPAGPQWSNKVELASSKGTKFVSFAKFSTFHKDLYEDFVAPTLKSDLFVETWHSDSKGGIPSNCSLKYKVFNSESVKLPHKIEFTETKDHSKWAVSQNITYWVCIGDINRQCTQEKRAGGTVCFQNKKVWQAFNNAVGSIELCPQSALPCIL